MAIKQSFLAGFLFILALVLGSGIPAQATSTPQIIESPPARPIYDESQLIRGYDPTIFISSQEVAVIPILDTLNVKSTIAYMHLDGNRFHIYLYDTLNHASYQLTYGGDRISPRINHNYTKIVFVSTESGREQIYTMNMDGSDVTQLENIWPAFSPAWSSDGNQIVFASTRDNAQGEIYTMSASGNSLTRITNNAIYDGMPSWSPNGTKIAYISYVNSQYRVWVMNTDGTGAVQLSQEPYSAHPSWSKDGSQIGYDADGDKDGWQELWVMNSDGSNRREVVNPYPDNVDIYNGSWNPGGSALIYTEVHWIYNNGQWYWTRAILGSVSIIPGGAGIYPFGDLNWYPDWGTTDYLPPVTSMSPLPEQVPYQFKVSWSASDPGGSGISSYFVQVKVGANGNWTDWLQGTLYTSVDYEGNGGQTYYFRTRAFDNVGNFSAWPNEYQSFTSVESFPPETSVQHLSQFARDSVLVQWVGGDFGGSGIKNYDIQYYDTQGGGWVAWLTGTSQTSQEFSGLPAHTYFFRSRATDNAGNIEAWPPDNGDAQVTFYNWLVDGTATDILGAPLKSVEASITNGEAGRLPSNYAGKYTSYGTSAFEERVSWSNVGYTTLPETTLDGTADRGFDIFLPPDPNAIQNFGFEPDLAGWQTSGNVISGSLPHTGDFSAFLGTPYSFGESIQFEDYTGWAYIGNILGDESGGVHALWKEDNLVYYRYRDPAGVWSDKELVAWSKGIWDDSTSSLAVTPDGVAHVFWNSDNVIYYSYRISIGNWSPPVAVTDVAHPSGFHIASSDSDGGFHVTWECQINGMDEVCYRHMPAGGAWDDIVQLTENSSDYITCPGQMIIQEDVVHLLFRQDGIDFYSRRNASGVWSVPEVICPSCPEMSGVAIAVDKSGVVQAIWTYPWNDGDYSHYDLYFTERSGNGTWLTPQYLFNDATWPQIVIDLQGRTHIAWAGGNTSGLFHAYRELDGSWHRSNPISDQWANTYDLIVDQQGTVHLIFPNGYTHWMGGSQWTPIVTFNGSDPWILDATVDKLGGVNILWSDALVSTSNLVYVGSHVVTSPESSTISQAVQVDEASTNPVLSFFSATGGANLSEGMTFSLTMSTGVTSTVAYSSTGWSNGWQHHTFDMSPWAGQSVTLTYSLAQPASYPDAWVYIDEVSLGAVYPDVWISMSSGSSAALPGEQFIFNLIYGNHGMVDSAGTTLTMTLPTGLSFVEASIPPDIMGQQLIWSMESLPANSGSYGIEITLVVDANIPLKETLFTNVDISTTISELEKWNNHAQSEIYIGSLIYLPHIRR